MGRISHRQFCTWIVWLDEQMNEPDRHDWYLMQVATEVKRVLAKDPNKIPMESAKLKFAKPVVLTEAQAKVAKKDKAKARFAQAKARVGISTVEDLP